MYSTSIFLLALALLVTVTAARPGRRPWGGHHNHHGDKETEGSQGQQWSAYRLPSHIRLPRLLAGKLGQPWPTFTAKKIHDGKYLLVRPALIFKLKEVANDTEIGTTVVPEISTTVPTDIDETTTVAVDEETTTVAVTGEVIEQPDAESEESTTAVPSFVNKRAFLTNDDDEEILFLDD